MYEILISIPGREDVKARLVPGTYRVGSSPASHLTLQAPGVIPRHCQLTATENDLKITDLGGGISVDGEEFREQTVHIHPGAVIRIGKAEIKALGTEEKACPEPKKENPFASMKQETRQTPPPERKPPEKPAKIPILQVSGIPLEARPIVQEIKRLSHIELLKRLNLKRMVLSGTAQEELEKALLIVNTQQNPYIAKYIFDVYSQVVEKSTIQSHDNKSNRGLAPESQVKEGARTPHIVSEEIENVDDPLGINHITYVNGKVVAGSEETEKYLRKSFSKCTSKKLFENYEEDTLFNGRYSKKF